MGGSVRDLLLGHKPKDFDIATNAHPEQVRRLFRNCRLIGRRFRLAHIFFGREIIEVATFRTNHPEVSHPEARHSESGMIVRDNIYGSMEDDAWRRDFSTNALYYDIAHSTVIDYIDGMKDIEKKVIRIIGDPDSRYQEDPVRMLRAIRFTAKLNFTIEANTEKSLIALKHLITHVSHSRLFEEILKLFYCGHAENAFYLLRHYDFFAVLFPQTESILTGDYSDKEAYLTFIRQGCQNTDARLAQNLSLNPAFLFSVLLWPALQEKSKSFKAQGKRPRTAFIFAVQSTLRLETQAVTIPRRITLMIEEIWLLQNSLQLRPKKIILKLLLEPRFRAAYDFLLLRCEAGESKLRPIIEWWKHLQTESAEQREAMINRLPQRKNPKIQQ